MKFQYESPDKKIIFELPSDATWVEAFEQFRLFLLAVGYVVPDLEELSFKE